VLSTTTRARGEVSWVIRDIEGTSTTLMRGFVGVSSRTSAVFSLTKDRTVSTFVVST